MPPRPLGELWAWGARYIRGTTARRCGGGGRRRVVVRIVKYRRNHDSLPSPLSPPPLSSLPIFPLPYLLSPPALSPLSTLPPLPIPTLATLFQPAYPSHATTTSTTSSPTGQNATTERHHNEAADELDGILALDKHVDRRTRQMLLF